MTNPNVRAVAPASEPENDATESTPAPWRARLRKQYEDAAWAPHNLADAAIHRHHDRVDARCATDPTWAAIEARRQTPHGHSMFLSDDLTIDDWNTQMEIRDRFDSDPRWLAVARIVKERPLRSASSRVRFAAQRVRRGWADTDTYSLDHWLCTTLAGSLDYLADHAHGWPSGEKYPRPEDWTAAIRTAAAGLRGWATHEDSPEHEAYSDLLDHPVSEEDRDAARLAMNAADEARLAAAQDAFRWIADNLPALWD